MMVPTFTMVGVQRTIQFLKEEEQQVDQAIERALKRLGQAATRRIREYLNDAGAIETGRLVASLGDPMYAGASMADDLEIKVTKVSGQWRLEIISHIPYAVYIEYGFHFEGPKAVKIFNAGWRVVQSFDYPGTHAFERGLKKVLPAMNLFIGLEFKKIGIKSSFFHVDGGAFMKNGVS